ncbi:MAG: hypothetical protein VX899_09270 [Myxococcota bacterium]|nr:hypothetical protein [Myxococcota bacterium]
MSAPYDLVVLGLGTAGSAVAALAAERGLRVLGLDARPLGETGARWINGVPAWAFDEAGLPPPQSLASGAPFHMLAGKGPTRSVIHEHDLLEVDMPALSAQLQRKARAAGAELRGGVKVSSVQGAVVAHSQGSAQARVVVDATGLSGLGLLRAGPERGPLCVAAQEIRELADPQGAAAFFAAHGVPLGQTLCWTGIAGGYSIVNVQVHGDHVALLTGSVPAEGHPSGPKMLAAFVRENPWVGAKRSGGSRALPLGAPLDCVGRGPHAAIGDSANMVYSAHGSGIAQQLLAARLLADVLAGGGDAWAYNVAWQRQRGGPLSGMVLFRRFSQTLDPQALGRLMEAGILGPGLSAQTLTQRDPRPALEEALRAGLGLARNPGLARRLLPVLGRMQAVELHHKRYPQDPGALEGWSEARDRLMG